MRNTDQAELLKILLDQLTAIRQMYKSQGFSKKHIQDVLYKYILPEKQLRLLKQLQRQKNHSSFSLAFSQLFSACKDDKNKRVRILTQMLVNSECQITKLNNQSLITQKYYKKQQISVQRVKGQSKYQIQRTQRLKQRINAQKISSLQLMPKEPSLSRLCSIRERCQQYKSNKQSLQSELNLIRTFQKSLNDSIQKNRHLKQMIQQQLYSELRFSSNQFQKGSGRIFQMF